MRTTSPSPRRDGDADDGAPETLGAAGGLLRGTTRLSLLGEIGMVGLVVTVLSLPVVTAVPALAAGALHLRRHLSGGADSVGRLVRDLGPALRHLWGLGLLVPVVLLVAAWNLWLVLGADLVGGGLIGIVSLGVGVLTVVVTLRTAGTWHAGTRGRDAVRAASRRAGRDLAGSALLVVAVVLCGVLVRMLEVFVLLVGGLLAMAAVAVEHRWAVRAGGAQEER